MSETMPEQQGISAASAQLAPVKAGALSLHPKTTGSGLMACVALITLWGAGHWLVVPSEVAAAFASILGFVGAYFAPWVESKQPGA